MERTKLGLGLVGGLDISAEEQIRILADIGFDSIFVSESSHENLRALCKTADTCGLNVSSVHAPFLRVDKLWYLDEESDFAERELIDCIRVCHDCEIGVAVSHVFIGFDRHEPTEEGVRAFLRLAEEAKRLGVRIALENTEGEKYLREVMDSTASYGNVGFCYDTGHALCYNAGTDLLKMYGDRLMYTHINDNLGVSDRDGKITWLDDLHLLPFDGILDAEKCMADLAKVGYSGELTFELSVTSKPGRCENDRYAAMGAKAYLAEVFSRADRVRSIFDREKLKNNENRT